VDFKTFDQRGRGLSRRGLLLGVGGAGVLGLTALSASPAWAGPAPKSKMGEVADQMGKSNLAQSSQALIIQTYANGVLAQPSVDFKGQPHLEAFQKQIDAGLDQAKTHADDYLKVVQPGILANITNIENYYALHQAVPAVLPPGEPVEEWLKTLDALRAQAQDYEGQTAKTVAILDKLRDDLDNDEAEFRQTVSDLNAAVSGDNGVLNDLHEKEKEISTQISGAIAGIAISGLTVVGGSIMIIAGTLAAEGGGANLIYTGVGLVVAGVGGTIGSSVALAGLLNQKSAILQQESRLEAEVKLATDISSSYNTLSTQVASATEAATNMGNAWRLLGGDLQAMRDDLANGLSREGTVRELFLKAAGNEVKAVMNDINTVKQQMSGVNVVTVPEGQTVADMVLKLAA